MIEHTALKSSVIPHRIAKYLTIHIPLKWLPARNLLVERGYKISQDSCTSGGQFIAQRSHPGRPISRNRKMVAIFKNPVFDFDLRFQYQLIPDLIVPAL